MVWDKQGTKFVWGVMSFGFCLLLLEVLGEVHVPGTDVFLFKEAGVNLALKGQFVASYLPHMPFGVEKTFAYYPPLYPFFFGVWSWLFGVGLLQSLAFNSILALLRTFLMLCLVAPQLPAELFSQKNRVLRGAIGLFFVLLCLVSTDRDRPDELALVFGLLMALTLQSAQLTGLKILLASLFLALCGATSPACGLLFGLLGMFWALSQKSRVLRAFQLGLGTVCLWALMILPIFLKDGASGLRFSKQVGLSSFPYLRNIHHLSHWKLLREQFLWNFKSFYLTGTAYVWVGGITFLLGAWLFKKGPQNKKILVASLLYIAGVPIVWTLQPYYLWFPSLLLIVVIMQNLSGGPKTHWGIVFALYMALSPLLFWEAKCVYNAFWVSPQEKRETIRELVLNELKPEDRLGITHDQYFTFRGTRQVVNIDYWTHQLSQFDYLYVTDLPDSTRRNRKERKILSFDPDQCFKKLKDFSTYQELPTPKKQIHYVRGNGGALLKNTCKDKAISLKNQPVKKTSAEAAG